MIQLFYDKEGDVLYLSVGEPRSAISEGLTVLNFSSRFDSSDVSQIFPIGIELHKLA